MLVKEIECGVTIGFFTVENNLTVKYFVAAKLVEGLLTLVAVLKGATSRLVRLEKLCLSFSNSSFAIRVNLLHS